MTLYEGQAAASPFVRHYPQKVRVVPLGIDLSPFAPAAIESPEVHELRSRFGRGPVILFVGRIVGSKGLDVLLDAARQVEANFVLVGDGPELERLRGRCATMGLEDKVTFTGRVDPDRVRDYVAIATIGVLPSLYESYGLAMVEIMTAGVPMVCTELGTGTTYINRHEETGLVVPPGDPHALASALERLLHDEALRVRLGQGASLRAREHFTVAAMMRRVDDVYGEALRSRSTRSRRGPEEMATG
jgi:rhamnosyl/mannosyltransferase